MAASRFPARQRIERPEDLEKIIFVDDMAEIDVPIGAVDLLPLKNAERCDSPRLRQVMRSIRIKGYSSFDPVIVRLGRRGRWVVVDGGHRLTAARRVAKEVIANLFGPKVRYIHFLLYRTPLSETLLDEDEAPATAPRPPDAR